MRSPPSDPVERVIFDALEMAGEWFEHPAHNQLDFYLPDRAVYIECKRMWSDRIQEQVQRAPNVIVVQGMIAARYLAALIEESQGGTIPASTSAPSSSEARE